MTPERVAAFIALRGEIVRLRRYTGASKAIWFEVEVPAKARFYRAAELIGGIAQGDREIRIGNLGVTAPQWGDADPAKGHEILLGSSRLVIQSVAKEMLGDRVAQYVIQARG